MTPEERALNLGVKLGLDRHRGAIADEIHAAIEEEREACAKVAEKMKGPKAHKIAVAIRARGEK